MKLICTKCGAINGGQSKHKPFTNEDGKLFCGHCGTKLEQSK
jgi:predicted SprT family Zn-dependent metalloprotease